ncbi:MAG: HNH endonuclease [Caldilineaceae bacterium]
MNEEWRNITNFPGYQVNAAGRVRSLDRIVPHGKHQIRLKGRELRPGPNLDGYLVVALSIAGVRWTRLVHDLVAEAFLGERPEGSEVHHRNTKRTDNRLSNLVYRPGSQHIAEHFRGQANPSAKLTDDQVAEIKTLLAQGVQGKCIARRYAVHPAIITRIKQGKAWRHIPAPPADELFLSFTLESVPELAF